MHSSSLGCTPVGYRLIQTAVLATYTDCFARIRMLSIHSLFLYSRTNFFSLFRYPEKYNKKSLHRGSNTQPRTRMKNKSKVRQPTETNKNHDLLCLSACAQYRFPTFRTRHTHNASESNDFLQGLHPRATSRVFFRAATCSARRGSSRQPQNQRRRRKTKHSVFAAFLNVEIAVRRRD